MGALTTAGQILVGNWLLTDTAVTRPTAWWVALHTGDPGADGSANEVLVAADADYVRKSVTFADLANGQNQNEVGVAWTVDEASVGYTVTHASIWTAESGGSCLLKGQLLAARTLAANDVLPFDAGWIVAAHV
ncbi:MAG TPA: hypothetical protein DCS09_11790 [Porphyromonadaceae bacterium]|nr:hypothetical protein [Porphyromonadaceae bacterium]